MPRSFANWPSTCTKGRHAHALLDSVHNWSWRGEDTTLGRETKPSKPSTGSRVDVHACALPNPLLQRTPTCRARALHARCDAVVAFRARSSCCNAQAGRGAAAWLRCIKPPAVPTSTSSSCRQQPLPPCSHGPTGTDLSITAGGYGRRRRRRLCLSLVAVRHSLLRLFHLVLQGALRLVHLSQRVQQGSTQQRVDARRSVRRMLRQSQSSSARPTTVLGRLQSWHGQAVAPTSASRFLANCSRLRISSSCFCGRWEVHATEQGRWGLGTASTCPTDEAAVAVREPERDGRPNPG